MPKIQRKRSSRLNREYSYNGRIAYWWMERAADSAHQKAYRTIADFIQASFLRPPRLIVDYACGAGNLLSLLSRRFARSKLVGLDGSSFLLELAIRRFSRLPRSCSRRISLIKTQLPMLNVLRGRADLVVFCFPNMMPSSSDADAAGNMVQLSAQDRKIAKYLSIAKNPCDDEEEPIDASAVQHTLEQGRSISQNLRRLLVRGGICVRIEYATLKRHEWSPFELQLVSFEEGTLDMKVKGVHPRKWFRVLASAYFRSQVLDDVYRQTGDKRDRNGGYLITVLRAL